MTHTRGRRGSLHASCHFAVNVIISPDVRCVAAEVDRTIKPVTEISKIRLSLDFITGQWLPRPPPVKVVRKSRPQLSQAQARLCRP